MNQETVTVGKARLITVSINFHPECPEKILVGKKISRIF